MPPEKAQSHGESTPLRRAGQPAEVAPAYVFFASQEASYITAEMLAVTGGQHLAMGVVLTGDQGPDVQERGVRPCAMTSRRR
jgi:Enoyl-(Acyl carrier protein) reductase